MRLRLVVNAQAFVNAGVLALAIAAISVTVAKAEITATMRERVSDWNAWFGKLVSCPYCFSHWVAFIAVGIYRPILISSGLYVLNLFVSAMAIVAVCALVVGAIRVAIFPAPRTR